MTKDPTLHDTNQNCWEMASILGTAQGLPAMLVGGVLSSTYGAITAMKAVIVGNLLLWAIGLSILLMTEGRNNAIENVKEYLGKWSGIFNSFVLMVAFVFWFSIQIDGPAQVFAYLLNEKTSETTDIELRIGAILGFLCSLLSLGGIKLIKWTCIICLPLIVIYQVYAISIIGIPINMRNGVFSFAAIAYVIFSWLPGAVNISTFFRHAKSKADSLLALSFMTIIHILFQTFTILLSIDNPLQILSMNKELSASYIVLTCIFVFLAFVCINLSNIYFASAGWDAVVPRRFHSPKKYAIIGMFGTLAYTFFQKISYMSFLERSVSNFIACSAAVLIVGFLMKIIAKHRLRRSEKAVNSLCWFFGCGMSVYAQVLFSSKPTQSLIYGISSSLILYVIIMFFEESIWAIRKIKDDKKIKQNLSDLK